MSTRLLYAGSVKNVFESDSSNSILEFEFTDDYSVFDWGKMPDAIFDKGAAIATIAEYFFIKCNELKIKNHFIKKISKNRIQVERCHIVRPEQKLIENKYQYFYSKKLYEQSYQNNLTLIPLEVVFRFGIPQGSSVLERNGYGFANTKFSTTQIEFYTKLEDKDRLLSFEEALKISHLDRNCLNEIINKTITVSNIIINEFQKIGLECWDGKLEWAYHKNEIVLVDSIGPDELRLIEPETKSQFSKEFLREYYRKTNWYKKCISEKQAGGAWKSRMYSAGLLPEKLPDDLLNISETMYSSIAYWLTGDCTLTKAKERNVLISSFKKFNKKKNIAVIGSGGREHALAYALSLNASAGKIICIPGNDGMEFERIPIELFKNNKINSEEIIINLKKHEIEFVVVGPDDALSAGLVEILESAGFLTFGPSEKASKLESSKSFSKEIMIAAKVKTAKYFEINNIQEYENLKNTIQFPQVVKYDGLALGKGVKICQNEVQVKDFLDQIYNQKLFLKTSNSMKVVIEEFLNGKEVSLFAICDGLDWAFIGAACDYKRLNDNNEGPNTGGMGAYTPVPWISESNLKQYSVEIFPKILQEMHSRNSNFKGILYAGLMVDSNHYHVLEFNVRFGDPETQVLLQRLDCDFINLFESVAKNNLKKYLTQYPIKFKNISAVTIAAASSGYPDKPRVGEKITQKFNPDYSTKIFYAGVKKLQDQLLTSGGRVYYATAVSKKLSEARNSAYEIIEQNSFEGLHYRKDIAAFKNIVVMASGRGSNFNSLISKFKDTKVLISALITNRKNCGALELAKKNNIPAHVFENKLGRSEQENEMLKLLNQLNPDLIVLAGYDQILSPNFINNFYDPKKNICTIVNIHPSLLPKYPGLNSYEQAFKAKDHESGITIHFVDSGVDTGPVIFQKSFSIKNFNSVTQVEEYGLKLEHEYYSKVIDKLLHENWKLADGGLNVQFIL